MRRPLLLLTLAVPVLLGLGLLPGAPFLRAQTQPTRSQVEPPAPPAVSTTLAVASEFTYQGLLKENGSLVNGTRSMSFQLHSDAACTAALGGLFSLPNVPVADGLFSVTIAVDPALVTGAARWIRVDVNGAPIGCQALLPVPYALSLRPGALIAGEGGLRVESSAPGGAGVVGVGAASGVRGETSDAAGTGGFFSNTSSSATAPDVVIGGSGASDEGNLWTDPSQPSSDLYLRSNDEVWVQLDENDDESAEFRVRNGVNTTVFRVTEDGDTFATGTKSAVVEVAPGEYRQMYAMESPDVVFEDFGSARLTNGVATVAIDPLFAEAVNLEVDYQVFVTPVGDWAELYVASKGPGAFEVRDAAGQSSVAFDYRITAKRRGYEAVRMAPVEAAAIGAPAALSSGEADE